MYKGTSCSCHSSDPRAKSQHIGHLDATLTSQLRLRPMPASDNNCPALLILMLFSTMDPQHLNTHQLPEIASLGGNCHNVLQQKLITFIDFAQRVRFLDLTSLGWWGICRLKQGVWLRLCHLHFKLVYLNCSIQWLASILFHNMKIVNDKTRTSMEAISSCLGERMSWCFPCQCLGSHKSHGRRRVLGGCIS